MAKIYVKNRLEPIELSNERAVVIKDKWLDPKKRKGTTIDLGDWAGEFAMIKAVETDKIEITRPQKKQDSYKKEEDEREEFRKLLPKEKAKFTGKAGCDFFVMSGMKMKLEDHPKIKQEVIKLQEQYFTKNNKEIFMPKDELKSLVEKHCGSVKVVNLGEKMRMPREVVETVDVEKIPF